MRFHILLLLLLAGLPCTGCLSLERMFRNSPLGSTAADPDRINLWPLYYQNGASVAVLWPVFDDDEHGFALRPLITRDGSRWELLPPLCHWDNDTGDWTFFPAYSFEEGFGVFPLFGTSPWNYVGPIWWDQDEKGGLSELWLFPILAVGGDFNYVGPVWWRSDSGGSDETGTTSFGLFPLFQVGRDVNQIGPVLWSSGAEGDDGFFTLLPLFGYGEYEGSGGMALSLLGGVGWNAWGETTFVNVLGPLFHYHYDDSGEGYSADLLWPLVQVSETPGYSGWRAWPLASHGTHRGEDGEVRSRETTALARLFRIETGEQTEGLRLLPLFSYRSEEGGSESPLDYLSLYGHKRHPDGAVGIHVGTPLLFHYRGEDKGYRWSSLLGTVQYQSFEDESDFRLLYYLYRQKTKGTETSRDVFPFISWDSGEKRSGFSFLWRLFHWERCEGKVGGHILFIPWGDI